MEMNWILPIATDEPYHSWIDEMIGLLHIQQTFNALCTHDEFHRIYRYESDGMRRPLFLFRR